MKKFKLITILTLILMVSNTKALTCDKTYTIKTVNTDSTSEYIGCTDDYNEAKQIMREYPSTSYKVAAIYKDDKIVNARYAVANFAGTSGLSYIYKYENTKNKTAYTYFSRNWGVDGAFIDGSPTYGTSKIKISGASGWTSSTYVNIVPISQLNINTIITKTSLRVRTSPERTENNTNQISTIKAGSSWPFVDKLENDGHLWYKIAFNDGYAYVAGKNLETGEVLAKEENNSFTTFYYVNSNRSFIHQYRYYEGGKYKQQEINLGETPEGFVQGVKYFSFDGNYFYTELDKMLDDYYNETFEHAVNYTKPYFNYYMYLPTHNLTNYTAEDFNQSIKNKGFTCAPDPNVVYYTLEDGWNKNVSRVGVSALYDAGDDFIRVQSELGVNALLMFGTAQTESGNGTSALALFKHNLFGLGAVDSNPIERARSYDTIYDSIVAYAKLTGGSYSLPTGSYFFGAFFGNKGSGFGVNYASDPYWGEKNAKNALNYDKSFGSQDYKKYTLGIKETSEAIPIKKQPSDSSATIYLTKNNKYGHLVNNMSYIVTEKVFDASGTPWYKVYTDTSLDKNQNVNNSDFYNFEYSYGYIKAEYLYVSNQETNINAESFSIYRGENVDLLKNVTAIDPENGDLTNNITVTGTVDSNTIGEYKITYKVTDNSNFTVSKEIIVTVLPSEAPIIEATDIEIKQFKAFDPKNYAKVYDTYGNQINNFEVVENTVNINQIGTYSVTYKATYQNFSITKKINVKVIKNEFPVLNASNRTIKLNDKFNYLSGVSASDIEDGDLTNKVTYSGVVDTTKVGSYEITYTVKDNDNQTTTKKITIKVEEIDYIEKDGDFYFNELTFKNNKLNISGYLAIKGTNNRESDTITYDLIARNNTTNENVVIPLERFLDGRPERHYKDSKYDYSATWFKGNVSLDNLGHGEYTLYVRARKDNLETVMLFRNMFAKPMSSKGVSGSKGFLFRNNNYLDSYPIELFVFENGLISNMEVNSPTNMINSYKNLELNGSKLLIKGTSYNIGVSYAPKENVTRNMIFENQTTHERYTFDIGSIVGVDIPINVSDGFTRERGWFNNEIDIKSLPVGDYIIYIQTKVGNIDDFGELNDIFMKDLKNVTSTFDNKKVTFNLNTSKRFRIEMKIEAN